MPLPHQKEKWWLPVPCVPAGGLSEEARKGLQHCRDCTNQILKAALAINTSALAEMDIPDAYLEALPKVLMYSEHVWLCLRFTFIESILWKSKLY